jgi:hypothetical protein
VTIFYDDEIREQEPRTLPDMYIEPTAKCGVCQVQNSVDRPLEWVCSNCGAATHSECGVDTEPSGGWDRDYDVNYWMCNTCLKADVAPNGEGSM